MHVYLIRHAQSENNILSAETMHRRKVDPDLTALGYQQRERLARHLAHESDVNGGGFQITRLYASAMYRCLVTAQSLGEALDLQPAVWPDLHEKGGMFLRQNGKFRGFGGMTRSAIAGEFPDYHLPETVTENGWYDAAMGYEPETHSFFRAIKVAKELLEWSGSDEVIALVSHAGFLDALLKAIFAQLPATPYAMRYYHDNTAITRINYDGSQPILHYMNRLDHLPAAMRSF